MSLYNFRPFTHYDLPMAAHWLQQAEVARWWGDPAKELAVITEDLNEPMMRQWVVEYHGRPFGYVQTYPVHAWPISSIFLVKRRPSTLSSVNPTCSAAATGELFCASLPRC
jgi:Acetyltransferase (GNAT) domain